MARFIRQSTAVTVHAGPAVDRSDGYTPEGGVTTVSADEIGVYKHEGTALVDISGTTTLTHRAGGMYTATLSTSDTDTLGHLRLYIRENATCLPFWEDYQVIPQQVYDSLVSTDLLQVDTQQWDGTNVLVGATSALPRVDSYAISDSTTAADNVQANIGNLDASVASRSSHNAAAVWSESPRTLTAATNITSTGNPVELHTDDKVLLAATTHTSAEIPVVTAATDVTNAVDINMSQLTSAATPNTTGEALNFAHERLDATIQSRSSHSAADVWAEGTKELSSAANITSTGNAVELHTDDKVLLAATNHAGSTIPTVTTNTDMRGTESALLAASAPANFGDLSITASTGRVDIAAWLGTAVTTDATTSKPQVDIFGISGVANAADQLAEASDTMILETVEASPAPTTTTFAGSSGLSATDDFYNGRIIIFRTGALADQACEITDYDGATREFTVTAVTSAPAATVDFLII